MPVHFSYSLKELRLALGLSQELMAGLLQTKRSLLAMAELGHRSIGAPAMLRIHNISQMLPEEPAVVSNMESHATEIQDWLERLQVERSRLKGRLKKLQSGTAQSTLLPIVLQNMDALQSPDFDPEGDQKWKAMMETALPDPKETEWEIYRLTVELETLDWKIGRLEADKS